MALGSENAGILFTIKSDSKTAEADVKRFMNSLVTSAHEAGTGFVSEFGTIGTAITSIAGPAAIAVAAVGAIGLAAATVGEQLFSMVEKASETGESFKKFQAITGFTAEQVSTLSLAAKQAGVSLESTAIPLGRFGTLLQHSIEDPSSKAADTLKKFGITAKDLPTAFDQLSISVAKASTQEQKLAEVTELVGARGIKSLLPLLEKLDGGFLNAVKSAKELGITLSQEDIEAAVAFNKTLKTVETQLGIAVDKFALAYGPAITDMLQTISKFLAENQGKWGEWGNFVKDVIIAAEYLGNGLAAPYELAFGTINSLLGTNEGQWTAWSIVVRGAILVASGGLSEIIIALAKLGKMLPGGNDVSGSASIGYSILRPAPVIGIPPGGGKGGGGGGSGGAPKEDKTFDEAIKRQKQIEQDYKASYDRQAADNELKLEKMQIDERAYAVEVARIALERLETEKRLNEELLKLDSAKTAKKEKVEEIANKVDVLRTQISTQQLKNEKELHREDMKDLQEGFEEYKKILQAKLDKDAEYRKALEERRRKANSEAKRQLTESEKEAIKTKNSQNLSILGDSILSVRNEAGNLTGTLKPILPLLQDMGQMVGQVAQGFGQLLNTWILMGTAGPHAVQKMVASVVASFAQMAAVQALMELAYGIAALTPWGAAIYGPAAPHFKAAALLGAAAAAAAVAGRAIAGNSFKDATGSGASSGNGSQQQQQNNNFQVPFQGFGNRSAGPGNNGLSALHDAIKQSTMVNAALLETNAQLASRLQSMSPGDVVSMAADTSDGAAAIAGGYHKHLGEGGSVPTAVLMRNIGLNR